MTVLCLLYATCVVLCVFLIVSCMQDAYKLLEGGMHMITDAEKLMQDLLSYPFHDTLSSLLVELFVHLGFKADIPLS